MNNVYAGWKRLGAFIIDSIILMIIGVILCTKFYNQLLPMGNWAMFVGFILFVLYYGLQNSALCKGQTIGKRIFRIKVVSESGQYLTTIQSLLRSILLTPVFIFNNAILPIGYMSMFWTLFVIGLLIIQVVLFFANKPSRQLLHDLIINSVCIKRKAKIQKVERNKVKLAWATGISVLIGLLGFTTLCNITEKMLGMSLQEVSHLQQSIKQDANATIIGVNAHYNKNLSTNEVTSAVSYVITVPNIDIKDRKLCLDIMAKVVSALFKHNEKIKEFNIIGVSTVQCVNIGLFKFSLNNSQSGSWQEWAEYINNNIK